VALAVAANDVGLELTAKRLGGCAARAVGSEGRLIHVLSDIQHFDIERWKSLARLEPPQADQTAAQHSIENALGTRRAYNESNNGPWVDEKSQWPTLRNGNVLV
jgi:hypothetical protein